MNGLYSGTVSDYSDTFDAQVTSSTSTSGTITFKDTNDSDYFSQNCGPYQ